MLLDPGRFSFIPPLEAGFATILEELGTLDASLFEPWPDRDAYEGSWLGIPLFMSCTGHQTVIDRFQRNQRACPRTMQILRAIPAVISAGFSWMEPGCHILPHVDVKPADVLRTHLGLRVPRGSKLRVGADLLSWEAGRCLIFDGTIDHETANLGTEPRVVLLVDARLNARERAYLQASGAAKTL